MTTENNDSFLTLPPALERVIRGAQLATMESLKRDIASQVLLILALIVLGSWFAEQAGTIKEILFQSIYYIATSAFMLLTVINLRYKQYSLPECCRQQLFQWIRAGFLVVLSVMAAAAAVDEISQFSLVSGKVRVILGLPLICLFFTIATLFFEEFFKRLASDELADYAARRYTLVLTLLFFIFLNIVTPITP